LKSFSGLCDAITRPGASDSINTLCVSGSSFCSLYQEAASNSALTKAPVEGAPVAGCGCGCAVCSVTTQELVIKESVIMPVMMLRNVERRYFDLVG